MFILLFIIVLLIVYVKSFKEDFTQEKVDKVATALYVVLILVAIYGILSSITNVR